MTTADKIITDLLEVFGRCIEVSFSESGNFVVETLTSGWSITFDKNGKPIFITSYFGTHKDLKEICRKWKAYYLEHIDELNELRGKK